MKNLCVGALAVLLALAGEMPSAAASGYWKYVDYRVEPDPTPPASGHLVRKSSGALQVKPGAAGSLAIKFESEDADKTRYLANVDFGFQIDRSIEALIPGDKVPVRATLSIGGNGKAKALPSEGRGQLAVDNGDYVVDLSAKIDEPASGGGEMTIPGGGPGATMVIKVSAYVGSYGAHTARMAINYAWAEGTPPPAPPPSAGPGKTVAPPPTPSGTPQAGSADPPTGPGPAAPGGRAKAPAAADDIAGAWDSQWGPVTFVPDPDDAGHGAFLGHWQQGECRTGLIIGARLDPETRVVTLRYYQPWNSMVGTARLTLSPDGSRLEGTWSQPGESGSWRMTRRVPGEKVDNRSAAPPGARFGAD